jgi:4-amino-4-deoxy-L-arabinose transferase-like glycosyltransferase
VLALPLQFFTFVVFAPEFSWSIATDRSLVGLSDTVARHYDDPSSLILTMRLISSIGGAVAALFAYLIVRKLVKDTFAALAAALIVTFLPISMQQSLIGTNDMVAAMAAAYGLISTPAKPILVGLASAAVVATKVPLAVWLVPVFVGGAIFLYQQQGGRALLTATARCLGAGIIGLISFDPYLGLSQSDRSRPWSPMFSPTPTAPCPTFGFSQRSFQAESSYSA